MVASLEQAMCLVLAAMTTVQEMPPSTLLMRPEPAVAEFNQTMRPSGDMHTSSNCTPTTAGAEFTRVQEALLLVVSMRLLSLLAAWARTALEPSSDMAIG